MDVAKDRKMACPREVKGGRRWRKDEAFDGEREIGNGGDGTQRGHEALEARFAKRGAVHLSFETLGG